MDRIVADAVVVAAGRSERMGGRDKLSADLAGRPVLAWSIAAIAASPLVDRIVLVRTAARAVEGRPAWLPDKVVAVVPGGARRQESVAAGIRALDAAPAAGGATDTRVLLVHDGARPLVTPALVEAVARAAAEHGAAIPVMPVTETLKRTDGEMILATLDRGGTATAQTPQGIRWDVLRDAMTRVRPEDATELTDEAALLEAAGVAVRAVPGEAANLKITREDDLALAESRLAGTGPRGPASGPTGIHSGRAAGSGSPASRSPARPASTATPTAMPRSTRSPARCSAQSPSAISAASIPRMRARPAGSPARTCSRACARPSRRKAGARWPST